MLLQLGPSVEFHMCLLPFCLQERGAAHLAEALRLPSCPLLALDLHANYVGPDGCCALASALRCNTVLTALDLSHNVVGPEGATALADALMMAAPAGADGGGPSHDIVGRREGETTLADALMMAAPTGADGGGSSHYHAAVPDYVAAALADTLLAATEGEAVIGGGCQHQQGGGFRLRGSSELGSVVNGSVAGPSALMYLNLWDNGIRDEGRRALTALLRHRRLISGSSSEARLQRQQLAGDSAHREGLDVHFMY